MPRSRFDVTGLVVKEKVRLELAQKLTLGQAAQKHGFVHLDVPVHQCADGAFVRRGAAGCDECGANPHGGRALLLQAVQGGQQGLERSSQQGLPGLVSFVGLKG